MSPKKYIKSKKKHKVGIYLCDEEGNINDDMPDIDMWKRKSVLALGEDDFWYATKWKFDENSNLKQLHTPKHLPPGSLPRTCFIYILYTDLGTKKLKMKTKIVLAE